MEESSDLGNATQESSLVPSPLWEDATRSQSAACSGEGPLGSHQCWHPDCGLTAPVILLAIQPMTLCDSLNWLICSASEASRKFTEESNSGVDLEECVRLHQTGYGGEIQAMKKCDCILGASVDLRLGGEGRGSIRGQPPVMLGEPGFLLDTGQSFRNVFIRELASLAAFHLFCVLEVI